MDQEKIYKFIEFSGDYSKLKSMGFSFQKLYAGNYMQWAHSDSEFGSSTRIWKKGSEVTIDRLTNYEGFFLEALLKARVEKYRLRCSLRMPLLILRTLRQKRFSLMRRAFRKRDDNVNLLMNFIAKTEMKMKSLQKRQ